MSENDISDKLTNLNEKLSVIKSQLQIAKGSFRDTIMPNRSKSSPGPIAQRLSDVRPLEKIMRRRLG